MRQIKKDGRLAQDKVTTLTAILFIPAIIIFALFYKGLSTWRADILAEKEAIERGAFVQNVYAPLAAAQRDLVLTFSNMQQLLRDTESLQLSHPNHAHLIKTIKDQWRASQTGLYAIYTETDKEIRFAWIAHNGLDQRDVLNKFSKKAVKLEVKIKKTENDFQLAIRDAQSDLVRSIDSARHLISSYRVTPKSKKRQLANQALREKLRSFDNVTRTKLLSYLNDVDSRLKAEIDALQDLIKTSGQQSAVLEEHLVKNQDLEKPLTVIINKWKRLEANSQMQLNVIYYAIEAEYVAVKLGLSLKNPSIQAMHKSLQRNIPDIVGKALKQRKIIDQSYRINQKVG